MGLASGPHYDSGQLNFRLACSGLVLSALVGLAFMVYGASELARIPSQTAVYAPTHFKSTNKSIEILALFLNFVITMCTECTGLVHATTLRWALIEEGRLEFNNSLRLFTRSRKIWSSNGALANASMISVLVLSYTGTNLLFLKDDDGTKEYSTYLPASILIGIALLLQVGIAVWGMRTTRVGTWSSNAFDVAACLVFMGTLDHQSGCCLRGIGEKTGIKPLTPSDVQRSPWSAHSSVKTIVILIWSLVGSCIVLFAGLLIGGIITGNSFEWSLSSADFGHGNASIRIFLESQVQTFFLMTAIVGAIQSGLTLGLHISELLVDITRDEQQWRKASMARNGMKRRSSPLENVLLNPQSCILLVAKPVLHWFFGQAITIASARAGSPIVMLFTAQALNLSIVSILFAVFVTVLANHRPKGHQPAAYGHVPTLVRLVDEWPSERVYWGHKGYDPEEQAYHAGTSSTPLVSKLKMDGKGYK